MNKIEITNLTKDYGENKGIFDVSFNVEKGEAFGFLGPNGAGKTTTLRNLMGFIKPDKGECYINNSPCFSDAAIIQQNVGYLPGELSLIDEMSGMEFIRFIASYRGLQDLNKAHYLLDYFELNPKGRIKKMSKGMKQKIGIVTAFMHSPDLYILDEPTSGLDPLMQKKFIDLLLEEKKRGATILMSSHMFEEVERTCDRIGIIKDGRIMTISTAIQLKQEKLRYYQLHFQSKDDLEDFKKYKITIHDEDGLTLTVVIKSNLNELLKVLQNYQLEDLDVIHQTLEEIFLHYYGKESN